MDLAIYELLQPVVLFWVGKVGLINLLASSGKYSTIGLAGRMARGKICIKHLLLRSTANICGCYITTFNCVHRINTCTRQRKGVYEQKHVV
jgi:hypothetical protein